MGDIIEEHPPAAILLEFHPSAIPATNYPGTPVSILHKLYALGYTEISHSGLPCWCP